MRALLAVLVLASTACIPGAVDPGMSALATPAGNSVGPTAGYRLYVVTRANASGSSILGAALASRGPVGVARLSADARRVEAVTGSARLDFAGLPGGRIGRLVPDGLNSTASSLELADGISLEPVGSLAASSSWQVAADPVRGTVALVGLTQAEVFAIATPNQRSTVRFDGVGRTDCGEERSVLFARDGTIVFGGVCSSEGPVGFHVIVRRPDGKVFAFRSPADEYDAPYAISPLGDRLYVAKPSTSEVWALRLTDGAVLWRSTYGPPLSSTLKRIGAANAIAVSPAGDRLYLSTAPRPGPGEGLRVIDAQTGAVRTEWLREVPINGLGLSPDGARLFLVTPNDGGSVLMVDTASGQAETRLRQLQTQSNGIVVGLAVLPVSAAR